MKITKDSLVDSIGRIDENEIEEVMALRRGGKKRIWPKLMYAAAALVLLIGAATAVGLIVKGRNSQEPNYSADVSDTTAEPSEPNSQNNEEHAPISTNAPVGPDPSAAPLPSLNFSLGLGILDLNQFLHSPELSEEEFAQYLEGDGSSAEFNLVDSREKAQAITDQFAPLPFPKLEGYELMLCEFRSDIIGSGGNSCWYLLSSGERRVSISIVLDEDAQANIAQNVLNDDFVRYDAFTDGELYVNSAVENFADGESYANANVDGIWMFIRTYQLSYEELAQNLTFTTIAEEYGLN